jgi:hypothetical protein
MGENDIAGRLVLITGASGGRVQQSDPGNANLIKVLTTCLTESAPPVRDNSLPMDVISPSLTPPIENLSKLWSKVFESR